MARIQKETKQQKGIRLLASTYVDVAHTEYNLTGTFNCETLVKFREALKLLQIDIRPYLPSEHGQF